MYKSNWPIFNDKMINNVVDILKSGKVNQWTGTKVFDFEKKFSGFFGVNYSIAVSNGSVALELCLKAIDLSKDDEVIVTSRSFIASASSITLCNGKPIFVDVDPVSQNITLDNIIKAYTSKTKAVILVHLAGWPCELDKIIEWCHNNNIIVIEDCAQAHGAKFRNKYVGTWGDINAWSFCQDKIMTTGGEGGMVTTNDYKLFLKAWSYKDHGKDYGKIFGKIQYLPGHFRWVHDSIGTNWRMTEIQASIGIDALDQLEDWIEIRRQNAEILTNALLDLPFIRLTIPPNYCKHSYYKYYCFVNKEFIKENSTRNDIIGELNSEGVMCSQGTCGEIYKEKAYNLNLDLPITKELSETSLMFMVDPSFTKEQMTKIASIIRKVLEKYTRILN